MRRMRDAAQRTDVALAVYDARPDRAMAAAKAFNIPCFTDLDKSLAWKPDALSISTPPDQHTQFVQLALDRGLHHFCEANIWTDDWRLIAHKSEQHGLVCAPSCSFYFNPLVAELKHLVDSQLGTLHGFQFVLTTYMPDWHPTEGDEYYARQRNTTAGREMVPFELLWLNDVFGVPQSVRGAVRQRSQLASNNEKLEDSWSLQIDLECGAVGQMAVFMGCPSVSRQGWCIGENGLIEFDVWRGIVKCRLRDQADTTQSFGGLTDSVETFYRDETYAFIDAVRGKGNWPMNYRAASIATATLAAAELSSLSASKERVDLQRQPGIAPDDYTVPFHDVDLTSHHELRRPLNSRPMPEPDLI